MIKVVGSFRLGEGGYEAAKEAMSEMISKSRAEQGCLAYHYAIDVSDPFLVHVSEAWKSEADLTQHQQSEHILSWWAKWSILGLHDRDLYVYDSPAVKI